MDWRMNMQEKQFLSALEAVETLAEQLRELIALRGRVVLFEAQPARKRIRHRTHTRGGSRRRGA
jgi:hypothetical protein